MKNALLLFSLFLSITLHAQYYYNDIIGTRETNRQMQTYLANKVRSVAATGYDQRHCSSRQAVQTGTDEGHYKAGRLGRFCRVGKGFFYCKYHRAIP